ncbi:putative tellurite resistance protein [Firmicutes bacterium CAG:536]|nr:putative tellurite resistance protein [Firmicutes bacterium CAG:536]
METNKGPELTLHPEQKEEEVVQAQPVQDLSEDLSVDYKQFNEAEIQQIHDFSQRIDITDNTMIMQYGINAQKKLADFSDSTLEKVKTKDLGEVGDMLSQVVGELREFDGNGEKKGLFGLFNKGKNKVEGMISKYEQTETNVNKIAGMLQDHQIRLLKDTSMLDQLFDLNNTYYKELSMYIAAGKEKLHHVKNEEIPALEQKALHSNLPEDAQALKDMTMYYDRFDKKLHDLELSRMIAIQTAPQIRLLQNSNNLMIEKIQSTLVNTIPLWKNQMVITLGLHHATEAAKTQQAVSDMTNELLKKNADALHSATVETAKESNRSIVDIETLKHTNEQLIQTFDDVLQIQEQGRIKRQEAEQELRQIENELKQKILEIKHD